jgi:hypothetical protein
MTKFGITIKQVLEIAIVLTAEQYPVRGGRVWKPKACLLVKTGEGCSISCDGLGHAR